jgi:hypothetical protein
VGVSSRIVGLASLSQGRLSHISAAHGRSGRQQQKHAGGAPSVPNRRGVDEGRCERVQGRGQRTLKDAPKRHYWQSTARAEE